MEKIGKKCRVAECAGIVVAKGLCDKHRIRLREHGHLEPTRPQDWGDRRKHPLSGMWYWHRRRKGGQFLCQEWKDDFWKYAEDIGERPSSRHFLRSVDPNKKLSKDNAVWVEVPVTNSEEKRAYACVLAKEWRNSNPRRCKEFSLLRYHGISHSEYDEMLESQGGKCFICRTGDVKLVVDHCHSSGKVRGLLCGKCNSILGYAKESTERLESCIKYLEKHRNL